ncbi:MAG: hypothetical protein ACRC3H_24275 [Lachnospiraceae bacterium]
MDIWDEIKRFILVNPGITAFGALTLIQIVPIRFDPWTYLLKWIGGVVTGPLKLQIAALDHKIDTNQKMAEEDHAEDMRWDIRIFTDACKKGEHHTPEEWRHIIAQMERYEAYVTKYGISNGVIKEETKYLRKLYEERNNKNDF